MKNILRKSDTITRFGGDEFCAIMSDVHSISFVEKKAAKINFELAQPFNIYSHVFKISASIGIAMFPDGSFDSESLFKNADLALYEAKERGMNTYVFYKEPAYTQTEM